MRLIPTQDAVALASMLRDVFAAECPTTVVRALRDSPSEPVPQELWKALADAGVLGLTTAEGLGGSGGALPDLGVFSVEAGRALCPMAVHSSVHASLAVDLLGADQQRAVWLPALASGTLRGSTALSSPRDANVVAPQLRADRARDGWRLDGTIDFVADADGADVLVVSAEDVAGERTLAFVVDTRTPGVTVSPLALMGGHRACTVHFADALVADSHAVLGADIDTGLREDDLRRVANARMALLSLDLVGVGEAALQRTVDHIGMRHQFGRSIASFQAAQHLVANMHIALAGARLAAHSAVFWIGRRRVGTRETAIAKMAASDAAKLITLDAHQLHGGMGYVLETDLHLWSERARVLATLGGSADVAATWLDIDGE